MQGRMLWRLAWRNLWRNPRRTGIVVTAVAVGMAGCLLSMAFNFGMVVQMVQTAIRTELGHIQVHAAGWDDDPVLAVRLVDGGAAAQAALGDAPEVRALARRVRGEGLVNSPRASAGVRVIGVEPEREGDISLLRDALVDGEWFGEKKRRVMLGAALARRLQVEVGGKIAVSVQDAAGDLTGGGFRVAGTFRTPSSEIDRTTILLRLSEAQDLLALGDAVTEVVAVAWSDSSDSVVDGLRDRLQAVLGPDVEVRTWGQLQPLLVYMVRSFDAMAWYLYVAIFTAMAFGIANVLLMAIHERTREIGMLRAMGMRRGAVVRLVVLESVLVTLLGLFLGMALAVFGAWLLRDGIDLSAYAEGLGAFGIETRLPPVLRLRDFGMPLVVAFISALIASAWPALRAVATRPAEALRRV